MFSIGLRFNRISAILLVQSLLLPSVIQAGDDLVYTTAITLNASQEDVWRAITRPDIASTYYLAPLAKLELRVGGDIIYGSVAQPLIAGKILGIVHGEKLQHSFQFDVDTHRGVDEQTASRVTYELQSRSGKTILKLTHDRFGGDRQSYANVTQGWPIILNGLQQRVENEF